MSDILGTLLEIIEGCRIDYPKHYGSNESNTKNGLVWFYGINQPFKVI